MSNMIDVSMSEDDRVSAAKPTERLIDIMIVFAVSGIAFYLEVLVFAQGWLPFGEEIRGAFSVVVGAITAVRVVLSRESFPYQ